MVFKVNLNECHMRYEENNRVMDLCALTFL